MPRNPSLPVTVDGEYVLLQRVSLSFARELNKIFSNAQAVKYFNVPPARSIEQTLSWIAKSLNTATAFHAAWAVFDKNTGSIAGVISYHDREPWQDSLRISYAFISKYFEDTWLGDSLNAIVQICFKDLKSNRVETWIDPDDRVSKAALGKLRFKAEGILRGRLRDGAGYRSVISYSLLASEWMRSSRWNKRKRDDSRLLWRLPQSPVDRLPEKEIKSSDSCIGIAIPVYLAGNSLKGFDAGREITINAPHRVLKAIVEFADGLHTAEEISENVPIAFDKRQVKALLQGMEDQGILISSECRIESQWSWARNPPIFYRSVPEDLPMRLASRASSRVSKPATGDVVLKATNAGIPQGLNSRKTSREFSDKPLTDSEISQILYAAYGVLDKKARTGHDSYMRRVVPSAGGIYPLILTWIQWRRTDNLDVGIYRVNFGIERTLGFDKISDDSEQVFRAMLDPLPVAKAHGVLLISANFSLSRSKYGNRAVPYALIEAGHVAQNVQTASAALGKGVWEIGGFIEREAKMLSRSGCEPILTVAIGNISRRRKRHAVPRTDIKFSWVDREGPYRSPFHLARTQIASGTACTDWCWGRSASPLLAAQKSVGEAVERYACQTPCDLWWASPKDVSSYISPEKFVSYPPRAYRAREFPFHPFSTKRKYPWAKATNILNGRSVSVLADFVYFNNSLGRRYAHPYTSVSTSGAAAYYTIEGAIERATLELMERHMFMACWLRKIAPPHISFSSLPYGVQARIMELNSYGWEISVLLMSQEPAISILVFAQHAGVYITRLAAASGFNVENILYHALEEVESSIPVDTTRYRAATPISPEQVLSSRDHGNLYCQKRYFKKADWLLGNSSYVSFKALKSTSHSSNDIFAFFREKDISSFLVDMTPRLNASSHLTSDLKVIRILIERTLPITFGYGHQPQLTPLTFGINCAKGLKANTFPHPFD